MKTHYTVALAMLAGFGLGAVAVQGLHAQAKPKAYTVTETEVLDAAAQAVYTPLIVAAIKTAGGRNFNTAGGKTVTFGGEPPKRVAINDRRRHSATRPPSRTLRRSVIRHKSKYGHTAS